VHIAIHDAVQAFEGRFEPYCAPIANASGSPSAAAAKAARDVLVGILPPAQHMSIDDAYSGFLTANGLTGNAGIVVGQQRPRVSIMRIVERFFGTDHITFVMRSNSAVVPLTERDKVYERLSEVTQDVIDVRVYQGIHFRFADEVAYRQGKRSADWAFSHVLRPVH
jgi:hypothetical protein